MGKLMMAMFILLWFGSPKFAQGQSSTSTCSTRLEAACATPLVIPTCCTTISNEIQSYDKVCICTEINSDISAATGALRTCGLPNDIITVCQGQKTKTNNIIYIVVPIAAVAVLITAAVSVFCICRGQRKIIPNVTNDPYNANVYTDLKRDNGYLPSDHASVPIDMSNVTPSQSPATVDSPRYEFSGLQADTNNFSESISHTST